MMLDLMVAGEIQDQVSEASDKAQQKKPKDAKGMVARMKQRREKRLKENDS